MYFVKIFSQCKDFFCRHCIVSTVRRKVLWSQKGERHNCTKSNKCDAIQCSLGKEKRTMCNYQRETLLLTTRLFKKFYAIATDESVTKSLWLQ